MGGRNWCERVTFESLCQYRSGDNGETHGSTAGVPAEIRTWYLQNTSQKHCLVGQLVRSNTVLLKKLTSGKLSFKHENKLPIKFYYKIDSFPSYGTLCYVAWYSATDVSGQNSCATFGHKLVPEH